MIFLYFLFRPLLSFATFSSACLFFYIPEDFNPMQFSLLLLLLYVMCVLSSSISFFLSESILVSVLVDNGNIFCVHYLFKRMQKFCKFPHLLWCVVWSLLF